MSDNYSDFETWLEGERRKRLIVNVGTICFALGFLFACVLGAH
jgi:hypothetical protein